jgi:hypothetical protein
MLIGVIRLASIASERKGFMKITKAISVPLGRRLAVALMLCIAVPLILQSTQAPLEILLQKLASTTPSERMNAFNSLFAKSNYGSETGFMASAATARLLKEDPAHSEQIKIALVKALEREDEIVNGSKKTDSGLDESYLTYYADLIGAVGSLRDARALNALLGAIATGGMATNGLANLGAPAVEPVIAKLHEPDIDVRQGAVRTLGKLAQRQELVRSNSDEVKRIHDAILSALGDPSPFVRMAAVDSAAALGDDPQIHQKLKSLSLTDSYSPSPSKNTDASERGMRPFPIRVAAERALSTKQFYVMRDNTKYGCRVQESTESPIGNRFLGPYSSSDEARVNMCKNFDDSASDTSKCWDLYPKDACKRKIDGTAGPNRTGQKDLQTADWTILIYMNGKNNLEKYAIKNFEQIASVDRPNNRINVVVEFGRPKSHYSTKYGPWSGVKRFLVVKNTQPTTKEQVMDVGQSGGTTDMGSPQAFADFVEWGRSKYPAHHYVLIIWNHGQGWRFQTASNLKLRIKASNTVTAAGLRNLQEEDSEISQIGGYRSVSYDQDTKNTLFNRDIEEVLTKHLNGQRLDLIGFDACLMSMIETAYALRKVGTTMVGSEELEPADGWDYSRWLPALISDPTIDAVALSSNIVSAYKTQYGNNAETTLSALDLTGIDALSAALSEFADALSAKLTTESKNVRSARANCSEYGDSDPDSPYVDLDHFLSEYQRSTADAELKSKAKTVREKIATTTTSYYASSLRMGSYGSFGISIYFPSSKAAFLSDRYHAAYIPGNTDHPVEFVDAQKWAPFLQKLFAMP